MKITIPGNTPSKKNSKRIVCRGKYPKVLSSKLHEVWHREATDFLIDLFGDDYPQFQDRVFIKMKFIRKTKHRFDYTNVAESIMDLLVDSGILIDDSTEYAIPVFDPIVEYDKDNPRCEVIIEEI